MRTQVYCTEERNIGVRVWVNDHLVSLVIAQKKKNTILDILTK